MPVCRVTSRNWIGQFVSAAVSGEARSDAASINPIKMWREFKAGCVALILWRLLELLEQFLVALFAGAQDQRLLDGLQGACMVVILQAPHRQQIIVRTGRFQLDHP